MHSQFLSTKPQILLHKCALNISALLHFSDKLDNNLSHLL